MYNRNYGGFGYASTSSAQAKIHSELLKPVINKIIANLTPN